MKNPPIAFVPLLEPMFQASFGIAASSLHGSSRNTAPDIPLSLVDFPSGLGCPFLAYAA